MVSKNKKDAPQYVDKYTYRVGIDMDLAPISKNSEIFADMTNNALKLGLEKALNHLNGHVLKVATMCSGTESPILALQLFQESKFVSWQCSDICSPSHRIEGPRYQF